VSTPIHLSNVSGPRWKIGMLALTSVICAGSAIMAGAILIGFDSPNLGAACIAIGVTEIITVAIAIP
jgi:hypothetical protein